MRQKYENKDNKKNAINMNRDHVAISVVKQKKKEIKWIIKNYLGSLSLLCGTEVCSKIAFCFL